MGLIWCSGSNGKSFEILSDSCNSTAKRYPNCEIIHIFAHIHGIYHLASWQAKYIKQGDMKEMVRVASGSLDDFYPCPTKSIQKGCFFPFTLFSLWPRLSQQQIGQTIEEVTREQHFSNTSACSLFNIFLSLHPLVGIFWCFSALWQICFYDSQDDEMEMCCIVCVRYDFSHSDMFFF